MPPGRRPKVPFPERYKEWRLIRTHGRVFAIPLSCDPELLVYTGSFFTHPAVLSAATLEEVREQIDAASTIADCRLQIADCPEPSASAGAGTVPVEFAGWLPVYKFAGNCGRHPQFQHTAEPPAGYRFTCSAPPPVPKLPGRLARFWNRLVGTMRRLGTGLATASRPLFAFFRPTRGVTLRARWRVLVALVRLFVALLVRGCNLFAVARFLQTRHLQSQLLLGDLPGAPGSDRSSPGARRLVFLTSIPHTYNQNDWVIEIEDPTTLFFPMIQNGHTSDLDITKSPYLPIVKAMLESVACKAILTHMKSTAALVPTLFGSETIRRKVVYAPLGVRLPARWQRHEPRPDGEPIDLLFINSWCQIPENFYVRGGLDLLEAFAILRVRYPQLRLTIRSGLPVLADHYQRIIDDGWVRVINRFLTAEEMAELHATSDIFLLPAARVHIVSLLQAMSYGLAVVAADGWGIEEYIDHGRNGLIVCGRYGKTSWADPEAGMLREDYEPMFLPDPAVVGGLVAAVSQLVEDRLLRARLGRAAREDVAERYNTEQWNRGLKAALDRAGVADSLRESAPPTRGVSRPLAPLPALASGTRRISP
jgi:glycosyltransferase involved in cell wall biosynthesis